MDGFIIPEMNEEWGTMDGSGKTCKAGGCMQFLEMTVRQMREEVDPVHGPARWREEGSIRTVVLDHNLVLRSC